ncbi:MAG: hypothetical protein IT474_01840 [Arenimonas sp.]|nr:hypothetical protein [Arenimonas sp.]
MDLISAFKSELFRPLATIIAPGTIAITPWIFTFLSQHSFIVPYIKEYSLASAFIFTILVTAVGFILENIGARIESAWDKLLTPSNSNDEEPWNKYLQLRIKDEIVGQRYLRTIVTRMKFELAISPALIFCLLGLFALNGNLKLWGYEAMFIAAMLFISVSLYMLYESYSSARTCARTRDQILKSVASANSQTKFDF